MKRCLSAVISLVFFIWILPLGVFIKPSQEKIVCGGQRAICLCHIASAQASGKPLEAASIARMAPTQKDQAGSGGGGHYFLAGLSKTGCSIASSPSFENSPLRYTNPLLGTPEHVPLA